MTIPSKKGSSTNTVDTNGVSGGQTITVAVPTGAASGDVYIIYSASYHNSIVMPFHTTSDATLVAQDRWTGSGAKVTLCVFAREYTGAEGANFTLTMPTETTKYNTVGCVIYQDADTSGTIAAMLDGTVTKNGSGANPTLPALTTGTDNSLAIANFATNDNAYSTTISTWTNTDSWDGDYLGVWDKDMATAGSTGTAATSMAGGPYAMVVLALKEAASGALAITPTGASVSVTAGSLTVAAGAVNVAPTGASVTVTPGTVTVTTTTPVTPTGPTVSVTPGTLTVTTGAVNVTPTGASVTVTAGTLTVAAGAVAVTPTGASVSVTAGTLTVAAGAVAVTPIGATVTVTAGTLTVAAGATAITPTGASVSVTAGTLTVTTTTPIAPTGASVSVTPGTLTVAAGAVAVTPIGATVTVTPGTLTLTQGLSVVSDGATVTVTPGTLTVTTGAVAITPAGATVSVTPGTLTVAVGVTAISPTGVTVSVTAGTLTITTGAVNISPAGASVSVTAGALTVAIIGPVQGSGATTLDDITSNGVGYGTTPPTVSPADASPFQYIVRPHMIEGLPPGVDRASATEQHDRELEDYLGWLYSKVAFREGGYGPTLTGMAHGTSGAANLAYWTLNANQLLVNGRVVFGSSGATFPSAPVTASLPADYVFADEVYDGQPVGNVTWDDAGVTTDSAVRRASASTVALVVPAGLTMAAGDSVTFQFVVRIPLTWTRT